MGLHTKPRGRTEGKVQPILGTGWRWLSPSSTNRFTTEETARCILYIKLHQFSNVGIT